MVLTWKKISEHNTPKHGIYYLFWKSGLDKPHMGLVGVCGTVVLTDTDLFIDVNEIEYFCELKCPDKF